MVQGPCASGRRNKARALRQTARATSRSPGRPSRANLLEGLRERHAAQPAAAHGGRDAILAHPGRETTRAQTAARVARAPCYCPGRCPRDRRSWPQSCTGGGARHDHARLDVGDGGVAVPVIHVARVAAADVEARRGKHARDPCGAQAGARGWHGVGGRLHGGKAAIARDGLAAARAGAARAGAAGASVVLVRGGSSGLPALLLLGGRPPRRPFGRPGSSASRWAMSSLTSELRLLTRSWASACLAWASSSCCSCWACRVSSSLFWLSSSAFSVSSELFWLSSSAFSLNLRRPWPGRRH